MIEIIPTVRTPHQWLAIPSASYSLFFLLSTFALSEGHCQLRLNQKHFANQGGLSGGLDLGVGVKNNTLNPSLTYYELVSLSPGNTLFIGWTGRLSAFYGRDLNYQTAPARLTRADQIDTVYFDRVSQTSLNLGVRTELNLGRFQLGASMDLLGFTFLGRPQIGRVYSSTGYFIQTDAQGQEVRTPFQGSDAFQRASPTRFNVGLLGNHGRGMLRADVYARLYLTTRVALTVGYQWVTTEVTLNQVNQLTNNARFHNRVGLPSIGLTVPLNPW